MKQRVSKVLAVMMVAVLMITGKADAATIAQGQHTIEHLDNGDVVCIDQSYFFLQWHVIKVYQLLSKCFSSSQIMVDQIFVVL